MHTLHTLIRVSTPVVVVTEGPRCNLKKPLPHGSARWRLVAKIIKSVSNLSTQARIAADGKSYGLSAAFQSRSRWKIIRLARGPSKTKCGRPSDLCCESSAPVLVFEGPLTNLMIPSFLSLTGR